jgi:hypothetical protein
MIVFLISLAAAAILDNSTEPVGVVRNFTTFSSDIDKLHNYADNHKIAIARIDVCSSVYSPLCGLRSFVNLTDSNNYISQIPSSVFGTITNSCQSLNLTAGE